MSANILHSPADAPCLIWAFALDRKVRCSHITSIAHFSEKSSGIISAFSISYASGRWLAPMLLSSWSAFRRLWLGLSRDQDLRLTFHRLIDREVAGPITVLPSVLYGVHVPLGLFLARVRPHTFRVHLVNAEYPPLVLAPLLHLHFVGAISHVVYRRVLPVLLPTPPLTRIVVLAQEGLSFLPIGTCLTRPSAWRHLALVVFQ